MPTQTDDTLALLADVAASFATRDAERVRALRDAGGGVDHDMWHRLAANGWLEILVPEDLGGAGLGLEAVTIVARQLGRAAFPEPFVAAGVLAPLVLAAAGKRDLLDAVATGDSLVAVAWQPGVTARPDGAGVLLDGTSRFVGFGGAAAYVVAARTEDGRTGLYWVPVGRGGLNVVGEPCADGTVSARLSLTDMPAAALVGPAAGAKVLEAALDVARVAVSAELIGVMDAALELTLDYLRQRKQFGRPIGSFQALQHRAVDVWMQRELAAAALETALRVHADPDSTAHDRAVAASSVKARAAHAAPLVCTAALQLHGAIGFTDEYDLGLYLNRALTLAPWLGNAAEHRRRYARLVDGGPEAR